MVVLGCCKSESPILPLGAEGPASVISNGNCHCGAVDKAQVLNFTLDYFVITETIVLFHKMFKLYSSENVDPKILRKMLIGGLLQRCMHILIVSCISIITKGLFIGVKLRLCRSCCIYYKLLMQLGYISVLC